MAAIDGMNISPTRTHEAHHGAFTRAQSSKSSTHFQDRTRNHFPPINRFFNARTPETPLLALAFRPLPLILSRRRAANQRYIAVEPKARFCARMGPPTGLPPVPPDASRFAWRLKSVAAPWPVDPSFKGGSTRTGTLLLITIRGRLQHQ